MENCIKHVEGFDRDDVFWIGMRHELDHLYRVWTVRVEKAHTELRITLLANAIL